MRSHTQTIIAFTGHLILFAVTLWFAQSLVSVGLFDMFFWSAVAIGLWSAVGTPQKWQLSFGIGIAQILLQAIILLTMITNNAQQAAHDPSNHNSGEWAFLGIAFTMIKSFVVFLLVVGIARAIFSLSTYLRQKF